MSTTATPALPPPPTPDQSATAVPSVQHTTGEKVLGAIGSRATAFGQGVSGLAPASRPHDFGDSSVGKMLQQHYDARLAEARVNYNSAQQLLGVLNSNVDPDTGQALTPDKRAKYFQEANAAWGAYAKSAGVNKEAKAAVAQKGQLFQLALTHGIQAAHQIATKLGIGGGGQQGQPQGQPAAKGNSAVPPPPSPSPSPAAAPGSSGSSAASAPAASSPSAGAQQPAAADSPTQTPAAGGASSALPPPPSPQQAAMDVPRLQAEQKDRHELGMRQAEADITSRAKIAEDQAKAEADAKAKAKPGGGGVPHVITRNIAGKDLSAENVTQLNGQPLDPDQHYDLMRNPDGTMVGVPSATAKETPYNLQTELHKEHPDWPPEKISEALATQKQTGLGTYAMVRLLDFAAKYDPELLTTMPEIFAKMGIKLPGGAKISDMPPGMPQDDSGQAIGLGMPGAPTGATRNRGQLAAGIVKQIPGIKQEISDAKDRLGPVLGRWNEFMVGKVGGDPSDPNYETYQKVRTDMLLLASGAAKMHLNSVKAVEEFNAAAAAGKMTPGLLNAFIDTVDKWARDYKDQGEGKPMGKGMTPPPIAKGSTVKFTDGGKTYNIPNDQVSAFKADHPNAAAASTR